MGRPVRTARPLPAARAVSRRRFLTRGSTLTAAAAVSWGFPAIVSAGRRRGAFRHGVASGDPWPTRVVMWTRVTPSDEATPGSGLGGPALVRWEISPSPSFARPLAKGVVLTDARRDHTVKIDVEGLKPASTYYYRFLFADSVSPVGRTRTAPAAHAAPASLRFGLASCSNYEGGYFSAYRHMAARGDLDFVLHVGDYIYEYQAGGFGPGEAIGRVHDPLTEIVSLADYRRRHGQYRADPDLQALHAVCPFICTWDDHELANDAWREGAENHQPALEGAFDTRQQAAYRAYFEWMPIRRPERAGDSARIHRSFRFGTLADLQMLDLRQYRDAQPASGSAPSRHDPDRTIMGTEQLAWLKDRLGGSGARWKLLGNSVMVSPMDFRAPLPAGVLERLGLMMGVPFNVDSWDGYTDDRRDLLEFLGANEIPNVTFLTGDIHSSWACEVPRDSASYLAGLPPVAVEVVGASITSDNLNELLNAPPRGPLSLQAEAVFRAANQHVKLLEFDSHGYSVVDLTADRLQADWYYVSDRADARATQRFGSAVQVRSGTNLVVPVATPLGPRP